jgi:hypothetical protein
MHLLEEAMQESGKDMSTVVAEAFARVNISVDGKELAKVCTTILKTGKIPSYVKQECLHILSKGKTGGGPSPTEGGSMLERLGIRKGVK